MSISQELNSNRQDSLTLLFLILLPIIFLAGSLVINVSVIIIDVIFLIILFKNNELKFLNNKFFYSLIFFWIYLLINLTFFSINHLESFPRSFGFIRFILFAFAINYFFHKKSKRYKKIILNSWSIIFLFISIDLIYEFIFGYNVFGFKSPFEGRLSGVLGDELKIGHFYSAFIIIILFNFKEIIKNKFGKDYIFYIGLTMFLIISLIIGERSNFIRILLMILLFMFFVDRKNLLKKIISLVFFSITMVVLIFNNPSFYDRLWGKFIIPLLSNPIKLVAESKYGSHYNVAIQVFKNNKLFGVGLKNYRLEVTKKNYDKDASIHPHQTHFEILSELGLIGYILFILIFSFLILSSIKSYLKDKDNISLCGIFFVTISLIPLIPSGSFFTTFGAALFWFNFSLLIPNRQSE